jgi:hypothetical protein
MQKLSSLEDDPGTRETELRLIVLLLLLLPNERLPQAVDLGAVAFDFPTTVLGSPGSRALPAFLMMALKVGVMPDATEYSISYVRTICHIRRALAR